MKKIVIIFILGITIYSCSSSKNQIRDLDKINSNTSDTLRIANDSLEYEIIIIEPGFNAWIVTQRPRGYYSEQFLETRNRSNVIAYNQRVRQPQQFNPNIYMQEINYQQNIHYGYEVNYLLYNYFLFLEQRYKQKFFFSRR
ncbi:DUF6146 family protein [Aquimarina sp. W85]|uniref:DUF6146 family protein n=1 Tax=Aquimarina rhodophyticola TaxID=3342246 RepID=UPI0036732AB3